MNGARCDSCIACDRLEHGCAWKNCICSRSCSHISKMFSVPQSADLPSPLWKTMLIDKSMTYCPTLRCEKLWTIRSTAAFHFISIGVNVQAFLWAPLIIIRQNGSLCLTTFQYIDRDCNFFHTFLKIILDLCRLRSLISIASSNYIQVISWKTFRRTVGLRMLWFVSSAAALRVYFLDYFWQTFPHNAELLVPWLDKSVAMGMTKAYPPRALPLYLIQGFQ